jgi:putative hydrolase of the HAD superfamily
MINMVCQLKEKYGLKVAAFSNEGRKLTAYRIHTFKLNFVLFTF